jgi:molybdopterin converting factor small subunit
MPKVKFTSALKPFFPGLTDTKVEGNSVKEVLAALDDQFPGLNAYLLNEGGALRKHVNIYIKDALVNDRTSLSDAVSKEDEILIYQALSGG